LTILCVEGAVAGYNREEQILKGASIHVAAGEIVSIIGPNGAGKSTLLKAVAGLLTLGAGRILFEGQAIEGTDALGRAKAGIAFVPQERNVFGTMTVAENLSISAFLDPSRAAERSAALYARYPMLAGKKGALARTLSGGQRQILAMAMGLMTAPKLLLLDEPTAGMSNSETERFIELIKDVTQGKTLLTVEHDMGVVFGLADKIAVLVYGEIIAYDTPDKIRANARVQEAYLGSMEEQGH
jgi:branched-chain amino acid transport system ATP-binding protein/neutral amino acid transport system ATP-binding protein